MGGGRCGDPANRMLDHSIYVENSTGASVVDNVFMRTAGYALVLRIVSFTFHTVTFGNRSTFRSPSFGMRSSRPIMSETSFWRVIDDIGSPTAAFLPSRRTVT